MNNNKKKIAVLGGGLGSLSSVFAITSNPNWQSEYEITVYQEGWRMGGKCASSRDPQMADRIEEHGLHIFFGFYDNAIKMMREAYQEIDRPAQAPLATFETAFKPHSFIAVQEHINDRWVDWPIFFPPNDKVPGVAANYEQDSYDSPLGMLYWLLKNLKQQLRSNAHLQSYTGAKDHSVLGKISHLVGDIFPGEEHSVDDIITLIEHLLDKTLHGVEKDLQKLGAVIGDIEAIIKAMLSIYEQLFGPTAYSLQSVRQLLLAGSFALHVIKSMCADHVFLLGWNCIDKYDFRQWLRNNDTPENVVCSAIVRSFYDLYLAFPKGDTGDSLCGGNISAGTLLHAYFLSCGQYKGAIIWKMQAGMGETVIVPLYQALLKRGVKFEFFSRVSNLGLCKDNNSIDNISIEVQATLHDPTTDYQPLIAVKGLDCWPKDPRYSQLVQGADLKAQEINLESPWSPWQPVAAKTLKCGVDFDQVILGISIGALPYITPELAAASPSWSDMLKYVQSSQTQAMQLWLKPNLEETGWKLASPVMDAYEDPFNTWADMSQTLPRESWPENHLPGSVAYFCNNLDEPRQIPPFSDHDFPAREHLRVKENAINWLSKHTGHLWPYISNSDGGLQWQQLVDLNDNSASGIIGVKRFDSQYWHAAINPSERYVLSVATTNDYRIAADKTDFSNLIITGDWTDNGFLNIGCVESTVVAGFRASRAICGYPEKIFYLKE